MSEPRFSTSTEDGVLTITLTYEERGNALDAAGATALADLFDEISLGDTDVRAILLTGAGRHFCTGADLSGSPGSDLPPATGNMVRMLARTHHRAVQSAFDCRLPVVAAVRGRAMGFGLHLALASDLIVAGENALFQEPFIDRGFSVDSGGSWLLPTLIGLHRAKQLIYFAEPLDAVTALDWGLVRDVVRDEELAAHGDALAKNLAARPTQAIAATKRLLNDGRDRTLAQSMHAESMAIEMTLRGPDFSEGMAAFAERRDPQFGGR